MNFWGQPIKMLSVFSVIHSFEMRIFTMKQTVNVHSPEMRMCTTEQSVNEQRRGISCLAHDLVCHSSSLSSSSWAGQAMTEASKQCWNGTKGTKRNKCITTATGRGDWPIWSWLPQILKQPKVFHSMVQLESRDAFQFLRAHQRSAFFLIVKSKKGLPYHAEHLESIHLIFSRWLVIKDSYCIYVIKRSMQPCPSCK